MRAYSRFFLTAVILLAVAASLAFGRLPGYAQAPSGVQWGDHANVDTYNNTRYESWVDISWSYWGQGWHIEKAFCLKPKENYKYRVSYNHPSLQPQVRVRAEIKLHGCANGTHAVVSGDGRVAKTAENFTVTINEHPENRFFMTFPGTR
jgi:hypothetical protein